MICSVAKIILNDYISIFQSSQDYEIVHKKKPDGTVVRVRRRVIRVVAIKRKPNNENNAPLEVDETPIEFDEVEVAENSPEFFDALDDPVSYKKCSFEIFQSATPVVGTIVAKFPYQLHLLLQI